MDMGLQENFRSELVSKLEIRKPVTVQITTSVRDTVTQMRDRDSGCVIVIDDDRKPIGIFTESMLTEMFSHGPVAMDEPIKKFMADRCPWVRSSDPIADVLEAMQLNNTRFLCVVDDEGHVTGLTGQRGLMQYVADHFPGQVMVQRIGQSRRGLKMSDAIQNPDEFQNPLENDERRKYDDPLEQALVEKEIGTIRHEPYTTISPDTPIHEAGEKLAGLHIACLLVAEQDKLVGVFADRDVLSKVAFEYDKIKNHPVRDVMTTDPIYVCETDSAIASLTVMAMCGYRHVPVLDLNDNLVGIISPQRVSEFLQHHFQQN